jgi:4-carboxymuconolactone decarboxylase
MAYSVDSTKDVVPKLREVVETIIYGDIWERPELSKRDRSLITVAALIARGQSDQMPSHMKRAINNGVTATELSEMITHLAFYVGAPAALTAASLARPVLVEIGALPPLAK